MFYLYEQNMKNNQMDNSFSRKTVKIKCANLLHWT